MKRIIALLLAFVMIISLCACESPEEKARREIQEAREAYNEVQQEVDRLESELESIENQINGK